MMVKTTVKRGLIATRRARRRAPQPVLKSAIPTRSSTSATSLPAVSAHLVDQTIAHAELVIELMVWRRPTQSSLDLHSQDKNTESSSPLVLSATLSALAPSQGQIAAKKSRSRGAAN